LVIDLQNDYLWEKRKKQFNYNTDNLAENINRLIERYDSEGHDVIYIAHVIQNIWTNRLLFGHSLKGTEGAKFYGGLRIVSDYYFENI